MNACSPATYMVYGSAQERWRVSVERLDIGSSMYRPPNRLATSQNSLTYQNNTAAFKEEWISPTPGRALRSSSQHCSTVLHSSSLNPRRFAPSGFFGRTPSKVALTARISDWNSR